MQDIKVITITINQLEELFEKLILKLLSSSPTSIELPKDERMNQKQAADFIGRSEQTMINYKKKGLVPYHTIDGTRLVTFYKSELRNFMMRRPDLCRFDSKK